MITELVLGNFKCFEAARVPFAALTLLAGTNASGKSTTIQALLLLRQSHLSGELAQRKLVLSGTLANVGTASNVLNEQAQSDEIAITITTDSDSSLFFVFRYESAKRDSYTLMASSVSHYNPQFSIFATKFNYLNAERVGPRLLYPMSKLPSESIDLGIHGEYTADVLARHRDDSIACVQLAHQDSAIEEVSLKLDSQARYWMQTIVPNFDFQLEELTAADEVQILLRTGTRNYLRPTNIGFGIIYTLPIIVGALVAPAGSLLIVENPEAHLHPAGQSQIGMFLARAAAAGIQVVIETHSDHVLNGIRRAVRGKLIDPDRVAISFFQGAGRVVTPRIYPDGGIDPWPEGFFDQIEKDLLELF